MGDTASSCLVGDPASCCLVEDPASICLVEDPASNWLVAEPASSCSWKLAKSCLLLTLERRASQFDRYNAFKVLLHQYCYPDRVEPLMTVNITEVIFLKDKYFP